VEISVGDRAPDFTLKDQHGNAATLGDLPGKHKVVLSFHPLAFTGVCQIQMQNLDNKGKELAELGAVGLGIRVDSAPAKKAWSEMMRLSNLQLLADFNPHGQVASQYGILREADGISERAVFVVDQEGIVRWKKVYPIKEQPDIDEILGATAKV